MVLLAECSFVWENAYGFYGAIYLLPLRKNFSLKLCVISCVKCMFYSMFLVHMVVLVCPCVGVDPEKKLAKRLVFTLKGCTFALAFGKQGLVWPLRIGAVNERVH